MSTKGTRGRPALYTLQERQHFAELVHRNGARQTREAMGRTVSLATLLKIAGEFGIKLKVGRRPR